jgi:tryptophan-rich sensory protein
VWTTLYTMLAASTVMIANAPHSQDRATALRWYAANAAFNAAWSWLFFGFHLLVPSALEIAVILATAVGMVVAAWRV